MLNHVMAYSRSIGWPPFIYISFCPSIDSIADCCFLFFQQYQELPPIIVSEVAYETQTKTVVQTQTVTVPPPANTRLAANPTPEAGSPLNFGRWSAYYSCRSHHRRGRLPSTTDDCSPQTTSYSMVWELVNSLGVSCSILYFMFTTF